MEMESSIQSNLAPMCASLPHLNLPGLSVAAARLTWSENWQPLTMLIFSATNEVSKINMEAFLCRKPKFTLRIMKLESD